MTREYSLRVRLTEDEKSRLQYAAKQRGVSMSEIIQDYCKRLPKPPKIKKDASCLGILVGIHLTVNLLSSV
ncbi:MAG: CopG family transcriptional regulator [Xenococcaceae cyanobacterium MO_167.B52]|nr:CopG family transcriptional regulator [Xenococcaceae cyanobacterium MO_167.B52]